MRHIASFLALISSTATLAATATLQASIGTCATEQLKQLPFSGIITAGTDNQRFEQVSGFADAQSKVAITRETPFRLASVGKLFTRAAIGILVDEGKLRLDDSVRRHLPELPEAFANITISQLLEHRSGVASMTRPDFADAPTLAAAKTARDLVALVGGKPLAFPPGSQEQYSNGGYLLLGAVIESAAGSNYRSFVEQRLFAALGMKASSFEPGSNAAAPLTRMRAPGQPPATSLQPRMEFPEFKASSAGDALSSAADMEVFAKALIGDQLLKAATKAAVFPRRSQPWRMGQAGGSAGSNAGLWMFPERNAWLIVLSNFDPPAADLMGQALNPVLLGEACKTQAPRAMPMGGPRS